MQFRHDINALRALAVTTVVLFHFEAPGFTGGFVGVDIFFVLSGFLMTGIVLSEVAKSSFSFVEFYSARARRIIPALFALCAVMLVFGFFYLPVGEYRDLIREVKASLLFYSNIELADSSGYFDTPPAEHWLLHTWSLSVEWQFYIVFPVVLFYACKWFGRQAVVPLLLAGVLVSYTWSIYLSNISPTAAFYSLPSRAFEMLVGALVYCSPRKLPARLGVAFLLLGGVCVLTALVLVDESYAWPGSMAALPVIGTALVLAARRDLYLFRYAPVQKLGAISYSAYLWHWPVVVLLYFCGLLTSLVWQVAGILVTIMLAFASYHFIEVRFKRSGQPGKSLMKYTLVTVSLVVVASGLASAVKRHPEWRPSSLERGQPDYTSTLYSQYCHANKYDAADCKLGDGDVKVILYGDSHAQSTSAAVMAWNSQSALQWALGGCPLLTDFRMKDGAHARKCIEFNEEKLLTLDQQYPGVPVVLFNHYSLYLNPRGSFYVHSLSGAEGDKLHAAYSKQLESMVCRITQNHPVYLVAPVPEMPFNVYKGVELQKRLFGTGHDFSIPEKDYLKENSIALKMLSVIASKCGAEVISPSNSLCIEGRCLGAHQARPLYFDDNHLVDAGNMLIKDEFKVIFNK